MSGCCASSGMRPPLPENRLQTRFLRHPDAVWPRLSPVAPLTLLRCFCRELLPVPSSAVREKKRRGSSLLRLAQQKRRFYRRFSGSFLWFVGASGALFIACVLPLVEMPPGRPPGGVSRICSWWEDLQQSWRRPVSEPTLSRAPIFHLLPPLDLPLFVFDVSGASAPSACRPGGIRLLPPSSRRQRPPAAALVGTGAPSWPWRRPRPDLSTASLLHRLLSDLVRRQAFVGLCYSGGLLGEDGAASSG